MNVEDIKNILIIGSGTMGQQIGLLFAANGYDVVLYDISDDILNNAYNRIIKLSGSMVKTGKYSKSDMENALTRIRLTTSPEKAAENADLINESAPENPELKGKIFGMFHQLCKPETVFTTNTSSLLPSMFAQASGRPERLCALHFHDVLLTNVVDVMPHPGTSPEIVELVKAFAEKNNLLPIVLNKEHSGYVFNFMFMAFLSSALTLAQREVAPISEIDNAWTGVMHTKSGPFAIMDAIGLDTVCTITTARAEKTGDKQGKANALFLKEYVNAGKLGIKSGQGFYTYK
ncbi:MAG: 3-hydroxybutyryl-CoA dehydrogenase [Desulfobacteraceae bacterium IS3]|nr:MAG: 3-hydroxybutyryl-CoA dehydrogenase [Desulfobacteraceae bacterium IS3]